MSQNKSADLLLVIDMQNVYTKGQEWACEGVEAASRLILHLLESPTPKQVIFTQYLAPRTPGKSLEGIQRSQRSRECRSLAQ